jgi:hypothetical protein
MQSSSQHSLACATRGARRLGAASALAALAALCVPGASLAGGGGGGITTVVTPLTPAVTYSIAASASRPALNTFVGYRVSISNTGKYTANHVRFTGTTAVTDVNEKATFSSADGATCTASADGTAVDCAIGALRPGQAYPSFAIFFNAPVLDTVTPLPNGDASRCATTDCVAFSGITYSGEGSGGGGHSAGKNAAVPWVADPVTLGTANPSLIRTALPKSGGTLFTGSGAVASGSDPFTTSVVVPPSPTFTTAEIREFPSTLNCTNNFKSCFGSEITIPGTFSPYLTVVLRQDASTIKKGTRIESVLIQYTGAAGTFIVGDCASPTTPRSDGIPCIAKRVVYRKANKPGQTSDLDCDFEWTLINLGNGSYTIF